MKFLESGSSRGLVLEGNLDAVKIGMAETYLGALAIFLGGTPLQVGALATLPALVGSLSQTLGMRLAESVRSRRRVLGALMRVQGALWMPVVLLALFMPGGWKAVAALIIIAALYQVVTGIIAPLWSSLVGDIIPQEVRGEFFGYRNKWIAITTFAAVCVAGQVIHLLTGWGMARYGFALVYLIAGCARIASAQAFGKVIDPPIHVPHDSKFSFWQFISRARHSNFVRFVLFISCMSFSVAVSAPYFAMYMLKDLKLTYSEYTVVIAAMVFVQFLVMRSWGRLSDQFGNRKILQVCGWLVAVSPWLWLISNKIPFLIFIQIYSGVLWAGFNLAAANFVFDAVTPAKRARCVAYQAIINGVLVALGSLIGGLLATHIPDSLTVHLGAFVVPSPLLALFLLSGFLRLLVMALLYPGFKEVRVVQRIRGRDLLIRVTTLRPLWGATYSFLSQRRVR